MKTKNRKPTRLCNYDYSSNGVYFITICSKNKKHMFSTIVGDGVLDVPQVVLSEYGKIIDEQLCAINNHYDNICIDNYVIMPNHIHMLINVCANGTSRTPSPTNDTIPMFVSTLKRFVNKQTSEDLFQRSYFDHIIRNEEDYLTHYNYIQINPIKWSDDELY